MIHAFSSNCDMVFKLQCIEEIHRLEMTCVITVTMVTSFWIHGRVYEFISQLIRTGTVGTKYVRPFLHILIMAYHFIVCTKESYDNILEKWVLAVSC